MKNFYRIIYKLPFIKTIVAMMLFYLGVIKLILSFDGDYKEAINAKAYGYRGSASAKALRGQEESLIDFDKSIELDPKNAKAYFYRGYAKFLFSQYEESIKDFDKAIELNPQDAKAHVNRGEAESRLGKYEVAIKDFDKAIELRPKFIVTYFNRGLAKEKLAKIERENGNEEKAQKLEKEARADKARKK